MKTILTISLWLGLITNNAAKPPIFLSYQDSIGQYSFGYSGPMSARSEYRASDGVTRGTYSYVDKNGLIQTAEYEASKELGFRVKATNLPEAPLPVQDTPEVKAAREKHLQLLDEAKRREESLLRINAANTVQKIWNNIHVPIVLAESSSVNSPYEKSVPASKNSEPIENLQREIALRSTIDSKVPAPSSTKLQYETITYTPEVLAAREAHFRAYENAARLAVEADLNPAVLMQYYRNEANKAQTLVNESKLENNKASSLQTYSNNPKIVLLLAPGNEATNLNDVVQNIDSLQRESVPIIEDKKTNGAVENVQAINSIRTGERSTFGPAQNLGSMNFRGTDGRLPSLNEFEQTKLKAGAYSTPIEISHISSGNLLSILYPSFFGTSAIQYVYL